MEDHHGRKKLFFLIKVILFTFLFPFSAGQLSSETNLLFRIQHLLEYPPVLAGWNNWTSFCYLPPSPSLRIACSQNRITELTIVGDKGPPFPKNSTSKNAPSAISAQSLSPAFSIDSLFTTLSRLSNLEALTFVSLGLWGPLPGKIHRFTKLRALNVSSNFIYGEIPPRISSLTNLQSLVLENNLFNGTVPDLRSLPGLKELNLGWNHLGPEFPTLGNTVVNLALTNNEFCSAIPSELEYFNQMQRLDLSSNQLAGAVLSRLFSLPSIQYLDLSGNRLTGIVPMSTSCSSQLGFVDLSHNLLVGQLPLCIRSNSSNRAVSYSWNCLTSGDSKYQHPYSFCHKEVALAAMPPIRMKSSKSKLGLILGIAGGIVGGVCALAILMWVIFRRVGAQQAENNALQKPYAEKTPTRASISPVSDARHISQVMRLGGSIGLPLYHVFTLEEIEEATKYFDPSNLMGEGSLGQLYKGRIGDGTVVVIRCLKLKQKHSVHRLTQQMEVLSKLRHRHLVSILGHCIVTYEDNPNMSDAIFLVFEYISNGTLRSHIAEWRQQESLKWLQRVAAVIGVARGIQFLHLETVPGIFGNNLKIENILLDGNLTAKISGYNLPLLSKDKIAKVSLESPFSRGDVSIGHGDKEDIYQLGAILLEVITGKTLTSQSELEDLKLQLERSLTDSPVKLQTAADVSIRGTFAYESLRTAAEIAINCLSNDFSQRPSIEDVLWNLQYSLQVQEGWASENQSSEYCRINSQQRNLSTQS